MEFVQSRIEAEAKEREKVRVPSEESEIIRSLFALLFRLLAFDGPVRRAPAKLLASLFGPINAAGKLCPKLNFRSVARAVSESATAVATRLRNAHFDESSPPTALTY